MSADDIFSGTASYYARYRPRIPQPAYDASASAFALDGNGRLLDVGCGTGQVAVAMHDRFEQVAAIDVSAQMLNVAREEARLTGAPNIDWHELPGEAISASLGTFRLVTCADALHWMDEDGWSRSVTSATSRVAGSPSARRSPLGTGEGDLPWQQPVTSALDSSFEQVLGNLYSTSYANRKLLGDDHERFENDLRERRARAGRFGHFEREIESSWIIGRVAH